MKKPDDAHSKASAIFTLAEQKDNMQLEIRALLALGNEHPIADAVLENLMRLQAVYTTAAHEKWMKAADDRMKAADERMKAIDERIEKIKKERDKIRTEGTSFSHDMNMVVLLQIIQIR